MNDVPRVDFPEVVETMHKFFELVLGALQSADTCLRGYVFDSVCENFFKYLHADEQTRPRNLMLLWLLLDVIKRHH